MEEQGRIARWVAKTIYYFVEMLRDAFNVTPSKTHGRGLSFTRSLAFFGKVGEIKRQAVSRTRSELKEERIHRNLILEQK